MQEFVDAFTELISVFDGDGGTLDAFALLLLNRPRSGRRPNRLLIRFRHGDAFADPPLRRRQ